MLIFQLILSETFLKLMLKDLHLMILYLSQLLNRSGKIARQEED